MTISAEELAKIRRWTNEPTEATYTDELIEDMAEEYARTQNNWPEEDTTVYDMHGLAAEIWAEKASVLAQDYDFVADGSTYSRSQAYAQANRQAAYHRSKRMPESRRTIKAPPRVVPDGTL